MTAVKELLHELIEQLPESEAVEVVDFIEYLKMRKEKDLCREM